MIERMGGYIRDTSKPPSSTKCKCIVYTYMIDVFNEMISTGFTTKCEITEKQEILFSFLSCFNYFNLWNRKTTV